MTQSLPKNLIELGDALERATRADLAHDQSSRRWARRPRPAVLAGVLAAMAIPAAAIAATQLISTGEVAESLPRGTRALIGTDPSCTMLKQGIEYRCVLAQPPSEAAEAAPSEAVKAAPSEAETAQSKLAASGVNPKSCVLIRKDGEKYYKCASGADSGQTVEVGEGPSVAGSATDWKGTVEPTVNASHHVNGGCRSENANGTEWTCYLGEEAVAQKIIGQGFLGEYAAAPGVG